MGVVGMIFGTLITWPGPVNPPPEAGEGPTAESEERPS